MAAGDRAAATRPGLALALVAGVQGCSYLLTFLWNLRVARRISVALYGDLTFVFAVITVLALLLGLGQPQALVRFYSRAGSVADREAVRFTQRACGRTLLAALVFAAIGLGWIRLGGPTGPAALTPAHLGVILLAAVGLAVTAIGAGLLQSQQRAWAAVALHPFGASLVLCVGYFWVTRSEIIALPDLLDVALWGHLLPGAVLLGLSVFWARRWSGRASGGRQGRFHFGLKAMQIGLVYVGITHLDRLMLGVLSNSRELGTYAVAARLAGLMYLIVYFLPPLVGPVFARENSDANKKQVYEASTYLVTTIVLPVALLLLWGAGPIVSGLFGAEYLGSTRILQLLTVSIFLVAATGNNGLLLQMGGRENIELKLSLLTFGLNFLLNLWLIRQWGGWGAAVATATSLLVSTACKTVICRREWGVLPALVNRRRHLVGASAFCGVVGLSRWMLDLPPYGALAAGGTAYLLTLSPNELRTAVTDLAAADRWADDG